MATLPQRLLHHTLVRYLLVGGLLFALDAAVFLVLVKFGGWDVRLAQLVSRTTGATAGFVGHRLYTFRSSGSHEGSVVLQGPGYVAVTLLNIAVSPFVVQVATQLIPWSLLLAKVCAEAVIVAESFLLLRLVFRTREPS